jgi:peptidoglycan DL-endopeptidase CwlO
MADFDVDAALERVGAQIRKAIADAEARATEIIRAAEREAEGIRARAEAEARDQVEGARRALEELTSRFGTGPAPASPQSPEHQQPPPPPSPTTAEPAAPPTSPAEPASAASEPKPPPTGTPAAEAAVDDTQAARLVAMKMALDGATREAIEAELERSYTLPDRGGLLDDVLARVAK